MTPLAALLAALPRLTLVVGKGGVGKTTCAAGIAAHLAAAGDRTLLLSTDPADTLGDALGDPLAAEPRELPNAPGLLARRLSAAEERDAFLARWRDVIVEIVDRGTYLDLKDVGPLVDAAMPGADEIFALLALARVAADESHGRIVVDTAPTGHTLRLLSLPRTFAALVALLDRMQEKHRFMVRALTHRYRAGRADAFLEEMHETVDRLRATLSDRARAAAVLVARAEPLVAAESIRYARALPGSGVRLAAMIVNAVPAEVDALADAGASLAALHAIPDVPLRLELPRVDPPVGLAGARALLERLRLADARGVQTASPARAATVEDRAATRAAPPASSGLAALARRLTIVGGKGGVGKTTVSCALAIACADAGMRTLLVSTDPAPSIADALAIPVGDEERAIGDVPGLVARQMDADAAFARFRDEYAERVDALFDSLVGRGMDATYDRAIMRELLALAPPGIDEIHALGALGETLAADPATTRFDRVVVDPAPTGHLLRLLEIPALALEWTHRLMRLMLEYREVAGLGDASADLLAFAKRTRAFDALLHDPAQCTLVATALDEPLVRAETRRLVSAVRERGVDIGAIVWNRCDAGVEPLPVDPPLRQLVARTGDPAPVGVAAIRAWSQRWSTVDSLDG